MACDYQGKIEKAAFDLHQTTEALYHSALLFSTFYTPHVHNLGFLRTQAERLDGRLFHARPRANRRDRAAFEKLKDAYVKARYLSIIMLLRMSWVGWEPALRSSV